MVDTGVSPGDKLLSAQGANSLLYVATLRVITNTINFSVSESDDAVRLEVSENFPPPHFRLLHSGDSCANRRWLLPLNDQKVLDVRAEESLGSLGGNLPANSHIVALASSRVFGKAP